MCWVMVGGLNCAVRQHKSFLQPTTIDAYIYIYILSLYIYIYIIQNIYIYMITEGKYARDQTSHIVTSWSDQIHGQRFFAAKKIPKAPNMTKWRRATLASTGRLQRQGFSVGLKFGYRILYSMEIDKFDKIDHVWSCKGKTFLWKLLVVIEKSYTSASTHSLPGLQISCKSELPKAARPDTQTIHGVSRRNCWEPAAKKRSAFPVTVHTKSIF